MPFSSPRMADVAPGDPGAPAGPHARADGGTPPPLPRPLPSPHDHPPNPRCHRATEGKAASWITVGACAHACPSPSVPPSPRAPPPHLHPHPDARRVSPGRRRRSGGRPLARTQASRIPRSGSAWTPLPRQLDPTDQLAGRQAPRRNVMPAFYHRRCVASGVCVRMIGIAGWLAGDRSCVNFGFSLRRRWLIIECWLSVLQVSGGFQLGSFVCGCLLFKSLSVCFNLVIGCWFNFHRFTRNRFEVFFFFTLWLINPLMCFSPMPFALTDTLFDCQYRYIGWYHSAISAPGSQRGPGCPWSGTRRSLLKSSPKHRSGHAASVCLVMSNMSMLMLELCCGFILSNEHVCFCFRMKSLTREGLGSCVSTLRKTLFECQRFTSPCFLIGILLFPCQV